MDPVVVRKRGNPNVEEVYGEPMYVHTPAPSPYAYDQIVNDGGDFSYGTPAAAAASGTSPANATLIGDGGIGSSGGSSTTSAPQWILYDGLNDRPLESYQFSTLQAEVDARARGLVKPVISFIGDVACRTGTSVTNMLARADAPLVETKARSMREMLEGSALPSEVLIALVAAALATKTGQIKGDGEEALPGSPPDSAQQFKVEKTEKTEGVIPVDKLDLLADLESHHASINSSFQGLAPIGADGNQTSVLQEIITLFRSRADTFHTDQLSGMAIIRPEVVAAIESAYEDVRRIGPGHGRFKLIHLMTSPSVSHSFAALVASLLNATPSEIQYPQYTKNFRGNGAATGARVSSGLWAQGRAAQQYKEKILWFHSVSYRESSKWEEASRRIEEQKIAHRVAVESARLAAPPMIESIRTLWRTMSADSEYITALQELRRARRELKALEDLRVPQEDARMIGARTSVAEAKRLVLNVVQTNRKAGSIMGLDGLYVLEIMRSEYDGGGPAPIDYAIQDVETVLAIASTLSGLLASALRAAVLITGNMEDERRIFSDTRNACDTAASAMIQLRKTQATTGAYRRMIETFDEDDKMELVYQRPTTGLARPLKNYYADVVGYESF